MSETLNEQELLNYIAGITNVEVKSIRLVLKHEQAFIDNTKEDVNGEVSIDSDELVDYVLSRPEIQLDELTIEAILDAEMDYLMKKGLASDAD
jgi:hypothetical protein